jgi:DNA repair exonuclease SbcCD ATPase subunit
VPDDNARLDTVAEELYAVLPAEFVTARDAKAKAVKADGDTDLAQQIKALRRPSAAAWLINLLSHSDEGFDPLSDLSQRLRDAQTHLDAPSMKELGRERNRVVADLVERAVALARSADPQFRDSESVRDQVTSTLTAAVADPTAEAAVTSGRLVSPLSYAGFGEVDLSDAVATPLHIVRGEKPSHKSPAPEPETEEVDSRALTRARADLEQAEERLEEAEQAFDEARTRRHQARLEVKRAQRAVDELEES